MKEIEKVSLGGFAFTLESDAIELATSYLDELERFYKSREGGSEILEGIEERMAELLLEKCGRDGVVSRAAIEGVIKILGRPEQIESESREAEDAGTAPAKEGNSPKRKLYRNASDKVVAGVCSGLGIYFQTDKVLFRLIFAVGTAVTALSLGWHHGFSASIQLFFPVLYLILWICMPAAKTVRQRWEQRGEDGTLNSIQRSVEAGAKEFEEAVKSVGQSSAWSEFANIFGKLIGVVLLIVGFAGLFTGSLWGFGSGWLGNRHGDGFLGLGRLYDQGLTELHMYAPQAAHALAQPGVNILVALVCFLPFLGILYGALQLLFGFKPPKWHPGLVIFILWLLSVVALGILVATGFISTELLTV